MNWIHKYNPQNLKDFFFHKEEREECIKWFNDYKNDIKNTKKVLLIIGHTGSGKTKLAQLLLKEFNYQIIEYNSSDIRSQKKMGEAIKKTLAFRNVIDMFNDNNKPLGILMDEIDTICKTGDKGGFTEFLNIIKMSEKYEVTKKEIISDKKKSKKVSLTLNEDCIKLYNPIVCTTNDINDKKINELKKYSKVIYLKKNIENDIRDFIISIYKNNNIHVEKDAIDKIIELSTNDIRKLIIHLEDIYLFLGGEKLITMNIINNYTKINYERNIDLQLIDATNFVFQTKNTIKYNQLLFDIDCLLIPLMVYHNIIIFLKNSKDDNKKKLSVYKNILHSLCIHDKIQTNIFEFQDWSELYDIASIYGTVLPNYYTSQLKDINPNLRIELEFTNLLNKISQIFVNKKMINTVRNDLTKINLDLNEVIYFVEIITSFLNDFTNNDECESDEKEEDDEKISDELTNIMNKYKMDIEQLENLLKIEKLNQGNDRKKRKVTITMKKEISKFLTI